MIPTAHLFLVRTYLDAFLSKSTLFTDAEQLNIVFFQAFSERNKTIWKSKQWNKKMMNMETDLFLLTFSESCTIKK